ncbi:MAG TPA: AfsA-related hotdog domain-containing protein [Thermoleophilaceae bacterium]|jgi:hypothetical protein
MTATTEATLDFHRTVDPQVVWTLSPEQTFVTDWSFDAEREEFRIGARLPRSHLRFSDTANPYPDVCLLTQVVAQAGVIVVAELLDVPLDSTFLLRRFAATLDPLENNRLGPDATRYSMKTDRETTFFKVRRTGRPPTASMITACELEGRPCGQLEVQGIWVYEDKYELFRRAGGGGDEARAAEPYDTSGLEPEPQSGRSLPRNVAIAVLREAGEPAAYETTVLVDQTDPTFYERPLDHVPGLLLLDAAKQATTAAVCRERSVDPSRVAIHFAEFEFSRFAELSAPVECRVDLSAGPGEVQSLFTQAGRKVCKAKLGATVLDG